MNLFVLLLSLLLAQAMVRIPGPGGATTAGGGGGIAVVAKGAATADGSATTLAAQSLNCTGANTVVAFVDDAGGSGPTGVLDSVDATPYVKETGATATNGGIVQAWYKKHATASGSLVVTATWGAATTFRRIIVYCMSGGNTTDPTDGAVSGTGSASPGTTAAITPSASGGIILSMISNNDGVNCSFTGNNSFTVDFGANGTLNGTTTFDTNALEKLNSTGAQTPSVAMTATGAAWRMSAVGFKQ